MNNELHKAIENIQHDIDCSAEGSKTGYNEHLHITLSTDSYCYVVDFCGIQLWTDDYEDRPYINGKLKPIE